MQSNSFFRAFTLVELIVVITILAILWTIGYISLLGYGLVARDTVRVSDLKSIEKVVELYKLQEWAYPPVSNPIDVTFSGSVIWQQWSFWEETRRFAKRISETPLDPLTLSEFAYSKTLSTQEFQVWAIVEKESSVSQNQFIQETYAAEEILSSFATSVVKWNYNGQFITHKLWEDIYILWVPSILANEITDVTLQEIHDNQSFVYEWGPTAPATYSWSVQPQWSWDFNPTNTSGELTVIHNTTVDVLNTGSGKIDFIQDVKSYYATTSVSESDSYKEFAGVDPETNPDRAISLANTYIQAGIGGLGEGIQLTRVVSEWTLTWWELSCTLPWWGTVAYGNDALAYQAAGVPFWDTCTSEIRTCTNGTLAGTYTFETCSVDAPDLTAEINDFCPIDYSHFSNTEIWYRNMRWSANMWAFAALNSDGSISAWWSSTLGWTWAPGGTNFTDIFSTERAFAALNSDGSISAWWNSGYGWTWAPGGTGFVEIFSTHKAFAALKSDGSIHEWGDTAFGWTWAPGGTGFTKIFSNYSAFAALKSDGSIHEWGDTAFGWTWAPGGTGFTSISSTNTAFAALKSWAIYEWGNSSKGWSWAPGWSGHIQIFWNSNGFVALKSDGSLTAWGDIPYYAANPGSPPGTNYTSTIKWTNRAFAALKSDGSIDAWWVASSGGYSYPLGTGFTDIFATDRAFAALNSDGSISAWWNSGYGWTWAPGGTGFTEIFSNNYAFAALNSDGSISVWWGSSNGWSWAPSGTGYLKIYSTNFAFAALKSDGSISVWWSSSNGWSWAPSGTGYIWVNGWTWVACDY